MIKRVDFLFCRAENRRGYTISYTRVEQIGRRALPGFAICRRRSTFFIFFLFENIEKKTRFVPRTVRRDMLAFSNPLGVRRAISRGQIKRRQFAAQPEPVYNATLPRRTRTTCRTVERDSRDLNAEIRQNSPGNGGGNARAPSSRTSRTRSSRGCEHCVRPMDRKHRLHPTLARITMTSPIDRRRPQYRVITTVLFFFFFSPRPTAGRTFLNADYCCRTTAESKKKKNQINN